MNVRQMHQSVNLYMQKIAAARTRKFLPEETDNVLNKMVERYIRSKLRLRKDGSGGYSVEQMDVDAIRTMLVTRNLPAYVYDADRYVAWLPPDYSYLIDDASTTAVLCGAPIESTSSTIPLLTFRQYRSIKGSPKYYETLAFRIGTQTLVIPADLPPGHKYVGYMQQEDIVELVPYILQRFRSLGVSVYWERFNGNYVPGAYIIPGTITAVMTIDGILFPVGSLSSISFIQHINQGTSVPNRLTASSLIADLQHTAFFKSSGLTPISELEDNNLYIHRHSSFTVSNVKVTYVRKPAVISLHLGTDCDLAPEYHQGICDLACAHMKGTLENQQGLAVAEADLERRVTL